MIGVWRAILTFCEEPLERRSGDINTSFLPNNVRIYFTALLNPAKCPEQRGDCFDRSRREPFCTVFLGQLGESVCVSTRGSLPRRTRRTDRPSRNNADPDTMRFALAPRFLHQDCKSPTGCVRISGDG